MAKLSALIDPATRKAMRRVATAPAPRQRHLVPLKGATPASFAPRKKG